MKRTMTVDSANHHFAAMRAARKNPKRLAALQASEQHYYGKPCGRGHDGRRYSVSDGCVECGRLSRLARSAKRAPGYAGSVQ
jgi:hypothetical protein